MRRKTGPRRFTRAIDGAVKRPRFVKRVYKGVTQYSGGPRSQKITGIGGRSHYALGKTKDRDHIIHDKTWKGTMEWVSGSIATTAIAANHPFDVGAGTGIDQGFPHPNIWANAAAYTSTGSAPDYQGQLTMTGRYAHCYVSSLSIEWKCGREDHNDDAITRMLMVPLNQAQRGGLAGTFPNLTWAGATAEVQWENARRQNEAISTELTSVTANRQIATLSMHIPIKKYTIMGYPQASGEFWYDLTANSSVIVAPNPTYTSYVWLGLYNNGASLPSGTIIDHEITCKFYVTYFQPFQNDVCQFKFTGTPPLTEGKEEKKEAKPESLYDEDYDAAIKSMKLLKATSGATHPPAPSPSPTIPMVEMADLGRTGPSRSAVRESATSSGLVRTSTRGRL